MSYISCSDLANYCYSFIDVYCLILDLTHVTLKTPLLFTPWHLFQVVVCSVDSGRHPFCRAAQVGQEGGETVAIVTQKVFQVTLGLLRQLGATNVRRHRVADRPDRAELHRIVNGKHYRELLQERLPRHSDGEDVLGTARTIKRHQQQKMTLAVHQAVKNITALLKRGGAELWVIIQ